MLAHTALSTLTSVHTTSSAAPTTTVIKDRPQPSKLEQILLDLNLRTNSLQSQASPELATPDDNYQVSQRLRMSYFKVHVDAMFNLKVLGRQFSFILKNIIF